MLDESIKSGSAENVFNQWNQIIRSSHLKPRKAIELYKGPLWDSYRDAWGLINNREKAAHFWILSAGYGLIKAEDKIVPYDITFQEHRNGNPSILSKINKGINQTKKDVSQNWWELLNSSNDKHPASIKSLVENSTEDDLFLIILGKDYLDAVFNDLQAAIKISKRPEQILFISNNPNDPTAKCLQDNWIYADSRLNNITGANNTLVNAKIAKELLWKMYSEWEDKWSKGEFDDYLRQLSSRTQVCKRPLRNHCTDLQVKTYIRSQLEVKDIPFSNLHREYRNSGNACEYQRFKNLYQEVKGEFSNKNYGRRDKYAVNYEKRNSSMFFFLPDWDDRVDPFFDFERDIPSSNRDPYEHDAYHYELYGHLNCDGILVSRTVLEDSLKKTQKAKELGIHQYLRLPLNVPVLGDCGAFNYITEEMPPYNTEELLSYYEELGFNYGVSIDHLIVPSVLKCNRYFKVEKSEWIEITLSEYLELKANPKTQVISNKNGRYQSSLFNCDNRLICKETQIDESEKLRRYELTIKNAKDFIDGHKKKGCSFTPIGAVQGWDPASYAEAVSVYQKMGYTYIAIGGLVKSTNAEILSVLKEIAKVKNPETKIHLFGVARLNAIKSFSALGVSSVDSAGMLRQAWLSASSNYYSPDLSHYTAIRVPPADKGKASNRALESGKVSKEELIELENCCLTALRDFDKNAISITHVMSKIETYGRFMGGDESLYKKYSRTLEDKPWKKCPCKLCKEIGIDIIIFRKNNRNRRRGFHNTWVFFNKFKELTDIS